MGRRDLVTALVLFVLALAYFSLTATRTFDLRDEGYLLSRSVQVAAGAVPHRDFQDVYGPGVFSVTALALSLGGGEILAIRVLLMVLKALSVVFGFAVARRFAPPWAAVFSSVLAIAYWGRLAANLNTPYAALFTLPLAAAALWLLIRALESGSARRFFFAGVVAGSTVLFKQSLGLMLVYGMLLSLAALALCRPVARDVRGAGAQRAMWLGGWLVAGALPVLPAYTYLGLRDYAQHFLPLHALVVFVAWLAWRRGGVPKLGPLVRGEIAPFAVGAALAPLMTVALYAVWGSTGALFADMFALPLSLENYYSPAALPPLSLVVSLAGVVLLGTGVMRGLAGSIRAAVGFGVAGTLVLAVGRFAISTDLPRLYTPEILVWRAPFALEGVLLPGLLFLGMLLLGMLLVGNPLSQRNTQPNAVGEVRLAALVPVFFTQALLCFEVFPRAGHNLWIMHGALAPLTAWVLGAWVESASMAGTTAAPGAVRFRRGVAIACACVVPLWLVGPIVRTVVVPSEGVAERRAPALPGAGGLALGFQQIADQHIDDLEELVRFLDQAAPSDAPLLVMTNEAVVPLFSGRRDLFEDHAYGFFLAGWGMLGPEQRAALDGPRMLERLQRTPDVFVVHQPDATARNMRRALPRIREYVEENFQVVARFGVYRVLRRSDRAILPSSPPQSG